jgi:hypothetical protein
MNLSEFIGEDLKISYKGPDKDYIWGSSRLTEEFPSQITKDQTYANSYSKFHKRMVTHFKEGEMVQLRHLEKLALEMYGYKKPVVCRLMRYLWKAQKVRRFIYNRTKSQTRGVHYIFLPQELWSKRDEWPVIEKKVRRIGQLADEQVREIRELYQSGLSQDKVAKKVGVSQGVVSNIIRRKTYKYVL